MINTADNRAREKAERETEAKAKRRTEQARIVKGLQSALEADEHIYGFSRGLIAGGLRGKLTVGFEALFAPDVNIGLTERRIVLQHVQPLSGEPSEILPHSFPLAEILAVNYSAIETFGAEPAGRLTLRLTNEQHFRLRVHNPENTQNARNIADVFTSLVSVRPKSRTSPTQSVCPHCDRIMDRVSRFCPYCGQMLQPETAEFADTVFTDAERDINTAEPPVNTEADIANGDEVTAVTGPGDFEFATSGEREAAEGSEAVSERPHAQDSPAEAPDHDPAALEIDSFDSRTPAHENYAASPDFHAPHDETGDGLPPAGSVDHGSMPPHGDF